MAESRREGPEISHGIHIAVVMQSALPPMPVPAQLTWSAFQSLAQLSAALNFGFAGLDLLLTGAISGYQERRRQFIRKMQILHRENKGPPPLSASQNEIAKRRIRQVEKFEFNRQAVSAYLYLLFGFYSFAVLLFTSIRGGDVVEPLFGSMVVLCTFLWLGFSLAWMFAALSFIRWRLEPTLRGG